MDNRPAARDTFLKFAGKISQSPARERLLFMDQETSLNTSPFPIIGIGAAAGGLEAISELLRSLPGGAGMAYIVVVHLGAHQESALVEIFSRETSLPVCQARDGLRVEPDHVYVIAPNTELSLMDGRLQVTARVEGLGAHLPIDRLFRSLASDLGSAAGGVVLSGFGADGAIGVQETAKEELQATNEEIGTINDELRSRIQESTQLSTDLSNPVDIDLLKRREHQLEEACNDAISIVETVREPLIVLDGNLRVRHANRAFYELFQLTPAEAENCPIYSLVGGSFNRPELRRLLENILPQESHFEDFEIEADFPHLGHKTLLLNARRVIHLQDQSSEMVLLAVEDVSRRRQAEDARQVSEARLQAIVQTAADGIITIDSLGSIDSFNEAAEQMFGYAAAEVLGQNVKLLMPSPYEENHDQYLARYVQTGVKNIIGHGREVRGKRKDGTNFPLWLAVSEVLLDHRRTFTGLIRDISQEKQMLKQLERTSSVLRRAEELMHVGNYEVHIPSSGEDYWSDEVFRILGLPKQAGSLPMERYLNEIVHVEDRQRVRDAVDHAIEHGTTFDLEYRISRPDGAVRHVRAVGGPQFDVVSRRTAITGSIFDNTYVKETQERALLNERLAAIGQVSAGLAHESRNALQRSQACLEMLASELEGQDRALEFIKRIQNAQDYMVALYEEVRDYAAPLKLRYQKTDLRKLLQEVWQDLEMERAGKVAEFRVQAHDFDGDWSVDPLRMRQVFRNIIENSLAACGRTAEIVVHLAPQRVGTQSHLKIMFRDNGPGLTAEQKEHVFAPFFTTKTRGTGLGMAIAKRIVEAHRGKLDVGSLPPPGAEFIVMVPEEIA